MKLISLNTWGGKVYQTLIDFINKQAKDTDIFCFQEIYDTKSVVKQYQDIIRANLLNELRKLLPDFQVCYSIEISGFDSTPNPVNFHLTRGKAIFTKDSLQINDEGDFLLYGDRSEKSLKKDFSNLPVTFQYISFIIGGSLYHLCNIHGISFPGSKLDTKLRIQHSRKIIDFLKEKAGSKIVTGDFNLLPQTRSINIFEKDMRNLIKEFDITTTRSNLSEFCGQPGFQKFADYTFVSKDIRVKNFQVPRLEISDHLPMILEFSK